MRFSVVCYLDHKATNYVRSIQAELGKLTGARASLDLWMPHITVGDGIEVKGSDLPKLKRLFGGIADNTQSFEAHMHDILKIDFRKGGDGETTTPYGFYLDVKKSEALIGLVENISKVTEGMNKWYLMPNPYHPHCTLAFKDLDKKGFEVGSRYLDKVSPALRAKIDHVALVEMLPNETREFIRFNLIK